jgi:hypothetical protein
MKIRQILTSTARITVFAYMLLVCVKPLLSQENIITLIRPTYEEGFISLSFEPMEGENIKYRVYRSMQPILSEADIQQARLIGEISAQELPLIDFPEQDGSYYFAVTVAREFTDLIPYLNTTTKPLDYSPFPEMIDGLFIEQPVEGDETHHRILIRFVPARTDYEYKLYRSNNPVEEIADMEHLLTVSGSEDGFTTDIEEDVPVYFAVTTANRLGIENDRLVPGRNLTSEILYEHEEDIEEYVEAHVKDEVEGQPPLERDTEESTASMPAAPTKTGDKKEADQPLQQRSSEASTAELIDHNLRQNFYTGQYRTALTNFQSILKSDKITDDQRGLVAFYTGQCYFYLGQYEKAVKQFVVSKEFSGYHSSSEAWIKRCLGLIR